MFPRRIAFVTSPTGAAVRDFLEVLRRRWLGIHVIIIPARVQGIGAAEEIAAAIELINQAAMEIDVLVVGRGGGSQEDLWSFNEEIVVRAIHTSRIPVVSAVGHEIDVTLADLVADVRALTPSNAAELVVQEATALLAILRDRQTRLQGALQRRVQDARTRLDSLQSRRPIKKPFDRIHDLAQQLDGWQSRCRRAIGLRLDQTKHSTAALAAQLESLSPLAVLGRGYTVTTRISDRQAINDALQLMVGEAISTRFATGSAISRVERIEPAE
jgi:exodeoxyribonuclease VII large subunit